VIERSNERLVDAVPSLTYEAFSQFMRGFRRQAPPIAYFATFVCSLILIGRTDEARKVCAEAIGRGEHGGFSVGSKSFPEMAKEWLG